MMYSSYNKCQERLVLPDHLSTKCYAVASSLEVCDIVLEAEEYQLRHHSHSAEEPPDGI